MLFSKFESIISDAAFKVPLQVEYVYPKGIVRPIVAYGINIYDQLYLTNAVMAGVRIRLNKSIYIGLSYDADFELNYSLPVIPGGNVSQSISTGILIKL